MKIFKKRIEAFHYEELSQDAKETAKNWFLNDEIRSELCTDNIMEEVRTLFPKSELKIQYSVSGCQGDGANLYGTLCIRDVLRLLKYDQTERFKELQGYFSEKEERAIEFYMNYMECVRLKENRKYCYCMADSIDLADSWSETLEDNGIYNINSKLLLKLENVTIHMISRLCVEFEKEAYDFLCTISDEDMEELCSEMGYLFNEDGSYCDEIPSEESYPELDQYVLDDDRGLCLWLQEREDSDECGDYLIVFWINDTRYYCYVNANSMAAALGIFFQNHPHITYEMIEDHMEI